MRALALLLVPLLLGASYRPRDIRACRQGGRDRMCRPMKGPGAGGPPALYSLLPTSGNGAPVMAPGAICDTFAGELVGSYVCLRGDGTSALGAGVTLTKTGGVTNVAPRVCPNGANCDALPAQAFDGIGAWTANQAAPPAGDFSMCALLRVRAETSFPPIMHHATGTTALTRLGNVLQFHVNGGNLNSTGQPQPAGMWTFVCGTYQRFGGGSNNVGRLYIDGTPNNSNSSMALPNAAAFPLEIGTTVATQAADVGVAIYTEKVLSAATISNMSAKALGVFTDAAGGASGYVRLATMDCEGPDGSLTLLQTGRPCIRQPAGFAGPAVLLEPTTTNVALLSQDQDLWFNTSSVTVANVIAAPDGTKTAERITASSGLAEHGIHRSITAPTGNPHALSAFIKAGTATFAGIKYHNVSAIICDLTNGTISNSIPSGWTASCTPAGDGWYRLAVVVPSAAVVANPEFSVNMSANGVLMTFSAAGTESFYAWGFQLEVADKVPAATSYIRSDGTATTRTMEQINQASLPAGMTNTTGCLGWTAQVIAEPAGGAQLLTPGVAGNGLHPTAATNSIRCVDSTNTVTMSGVNVSTAPASASCEWSGSTLEVRSPGMSTASGAYDGSILGSSWTLGSGDSSGTVSPGAFLVSNIKLGDKPNACR